MWARASAGKRLLALKLHQLCGAWIQQKPAVLYLKLALAEVVWVAVMQLCVSIKLVLAFTLEWLLVNGKQTQRKCIPMFLLVLGYREKGAVSISMGWLYLSERNSCSNHFSLHSWGCLMLDNKPGYLGWRSVLYLWTASCVGIASAMAVPQPVLKPITVSASALLFALWDCSWNLVLAPKWKIYYG